MFPSPSPSATIPAGIRKSSANPPRRANDRSTNRWDGVRRTPPARRALILGIFFRLRVSEFLPPRRGFSKNPPPLHRLFEWNVVRRPACSRNKSSARPHCAPSPLPRFSLHHRTTCAGLSPRIRAPDVPAADGFLDCEPRSVLGIWRQVRPANRSVRAVPCASVPAALCRIPRGHDAEASHGHHGAGLTLVRLAPAHGCAASGRRQRKTLSPLLVLLSRMGIPPNLVLNVWRRSRGQAARLRRGANAPHSCRSLRYLQVFSKDGRPDQGRPRRPPRR